jgi:putative FmdB family regulatory protein
MPTYSYKCNKCKKDFELFFYIRQYQPSPKCIYCGSNNTIREVVKDAQTINSSIIKNDSELKTIGDLANRNRDRMSTDHKIGLEQKHNEYKENKPTKELPKGMSRISKPKNKTRWTNG